MSPPSRPLQPLDAPPFDSPAAASSWLETNGLLHLERMGLGVLAPRVEVAFAPQFRAVASRRRLVELLSPESLQRWEREAMPSPRLREMLPRLAWGFVQDERDGAAEARARLSRRLEAPAEPTRARLHALLARLRATLPDTLAPRPERLLHPELLVLDPGLPGFRHLERRGTELPLEERRGFILPDVQLVFTPEAATATCSCSAPACVHVLAAVDTALLWLKGGPADDATTAALQDLLRPAWERTLMALERVVDELPSSDPRAELDWRVSVIRGFGVELRPYVRRRNRKGQLSAGAKLSRRKLIQEYGARLSPADARLAALMPENEGPASRSLLLELCGRTDLTLDDAHGGRVRVERAKVGLIAEDRGGTVFITAGVDGAPLPENLLEWVRRSLPDEGLYLWDEGARLLTVLEATPEVKGVLGVLGHAPQAFPPESHPALLERLARLSQRLPVAMPRTVMGEAVAPALQLVLRLEAQLGGAIGVEVLVRPLAGGTAWTPGEGPRDVFVRRDGQAVHAVRDFVRERAAAEALVAQLPLEDADALAVSFAYHFGAGPGALAVLAAARALEPPPEVEWAGRPLRLYSSGGPPGLKVTLEKRRDWFGMLGHLSVEGERVELARLLESARRKERFVQVSADSYLEVEGALRQHLERLSDHVYAGGRGLELGPSAAEVVRDLEAAGAKLDADAAWRGLVERIFASQELRPRPPAGLKATLRAYQAEGFQWLARLASWGAGGVLADDMGLGKTVQALALLLYRRKLGPALVVAPTSVAYNWREEAQRFAPSLRMVFLTESSDRGETLARLRPNDVLVVSYGLLVQDAERLAAVRFATLVFDEAQALKNATTQRFRAARDLQGDFKFALSGTPLENHLGELWSLFGVVFPGLLGSWEAFRTRFAAPIERGVDPTAAPALARVIQPFLLRRTKAQVEAELPPRTDVKVPVVLSPEEWTLYEDARLAALSDLETRKSKLREQERRIEVLAALTRLRLLASNPRLYEEGSAVKSAKLERLMELVDALQLEGQRALVFSQFTSHLALVREALDARGLSYEYLDGATPERARAQAVKAFQDGTAPLFLISLKAGGFGLNLTGATSVIHLDPWWNPAVEDQASDRAHRIGQERPVTVYRLVALGTIEEKMLELHQHKRALVAGVLEGKERAGRLTSRELLALLARGEQDEVPGVLH